MMTTRTIRVALLLGLFTLPLPHRAAAGEVTPFQFAVPQANQLSLAGAVQVRLLLPTGFVADSLRVELDGNEVEEGLTLNGNTLSGTIPDVPVGTHVLRGFVDVQQEGTPTPLETQASFDTIALENPDECEVLNNVECFLPYPSSRFLEPAATPTGFRLRFPAAGMPMQNNARLLPDPYNVLDGFSPTVQILMHFPGNVDLVHSGASQLLDTTRSIDLRSLDADSPSVLIDADSGQRILHFLEPDARAANNPARQLLFLRPGRSLQPGHRYIVAMRNLVHADGSPVEAEAAFAALRDNRPTDIAGIEDRRSAFADIFTRLADAGVARDSLVLAFDFTVQSDEGLTGQMLAMRDTTLTWLDHAIEVGEDLFTVTRVTDSDCSRPGAFEWRRVEGSYTVPLFLTSDPVTATDSLGVLNVDENGNPESNGFTHPEFTIAIPCAVLTPLVGDCDRDLRVRVNELVSGVRVALSQAALTTCSAFDANDDDRVTVDELVQGVDASLHGGGAPKGAAVLGHGLFMTGRDFVPLVTLAIGPLLQLQGLDPIELIGGGTDWRGLSGKDLGFIANVIPDLNNIAALPDRLRQGQLNALALGRMMKSGAFNVDPAFQTPSGVGVFAGPAANLYYYGISLGGIMGLMHAALSPDVVAAGIDEGSINFSMLLQRSTQAAPFETAYIATGITDPIQTALLLGMTHELWVRGEPAGYATHITSNPLPGTPIKQILMTTAFLDQQVSNQASEITARTLNLSSLVPGSLNSGLAEIPDANGPLSSAYIVYDTATFRLNQPGPWIPPLANLIPASNRCDPHGERRPTIPASLQQISNLFRPGGMIENFCDGTCDAAIPFEVPLGGACDPTQ